MAGGLAPPPATARRLLEVAMGAPPREARRAASCERQVLRVACFVLLEWLLRHETLLRAAPSAGDSVRDAAAGLAEAVLAAMPNPPAREALLRRLSRAARELGASRALRDFDVLGRVYHRLLLRGAGPSYATYYTSVPAARLLAGLVFGARKGASDRLTGDATSSRRHVARRPFKVLDPACGSGTLLAAAVSALKGTAAEPAVDGRRAAPARCEWHGWDVMPFAAQLARTTLALHGLAPGAGRTNILAVAAGLDRQGVARLGSLDALAPASQGGGAGRVARPRVAALTGAGDAVAVEVPTFDVVLMNPPFSRSANPNVKFGYSDARTKALMDARLRALTRQLGVRGVGHAGLAAYFVLLGHQLLEPGGRLAVVLPRSCLSGVSWAGVRELIMREYQLEYVIANADPGDAVAGVEPWNWSEQTELGEVMWVARKVAPGAEREPVRYLNLWRKPAGPDGGIYLASQVARAGPSSAVSLREGRARVVELDGAPAGAIYAVPQDDLARNWLFPCLFASPRLNALAAEWLVQPPFETVPLASLLTGVGPDIAQVKRAFARAHSATRYPILWGHQGTMRVLRLDESFVGYGEATPGGRGGALHEAHAATLLLAERPHLHTESLLSLEVPVPVLSTAFWELRLAAPELAAVLHLWFQSTFGFVSYLAHATSSMGDIFKLKKGQLGRIPVVRPALVLDDAARQLYAEVCRATWMRFPDEFARAARGDGPRKAIDDFLIRRLGLALDLRPYYELLAADPVITTQRADARG